MTLKPYAIGYRWYRTAVPIPTDGPAILSAPWPRSQSIINSAHRQQDSPLLPLLPVDQPFEGVKTENIADDIVTGANTPLGRINHPEGQMTPDLTAGRNVTPSSGKTPSRKGNVRAQSRASPYPKMVYQAKLPLDEPPLPSIYVPENLRERKMYRGDGKTRYYASKSGTKIEMPPPVPAGVEVMHGTLYLHEANTRTGELDCRQAWVRKVSAEGVAWNPITSGDRFNFTEADTFFLSISTSGIPAWVMPKTILRQRCSPGNKVTKVSPRKRMRTTRVFSSFDSDA
ncbi:hypothetical protein FPV67DRAFT_1676128 [Lyophyllum atratum]|nr:hypothetical protein FPV67DRAFT_1676128 [Lyophyllum atratum]